jgi:hypothetical protein
MKKILKANWEQLHLLESAFLSTGKMTLVMRGGNQALFKLQEKYDPVVTVRKYELLCRDLMPVSLTFEYHENEGYGFLQTNGRGIRVLKSMMPDTFGNVSEDENERTEQDIEVKPYTKFKPEPA